MRPAAIALTPLLAALACRTVPLSAHLDSRGAGCMTASEATMSTPVRWRWPQGMRDERVRVGPSVDSVSALLARRWEVLVVTTQGHPALPTRRWRMELVPVTGAAAPEANDAELLWSTAPRPKSRLPRMQLRYARAGNTMMLVAGAPGLFGYGSEFLFVDSASTTRISGRWVHGGQPGAMLRPVRRGGVTVDEPRRGYFCAMRRPPSPD